MQFSHTCPYCHAQNTAFAITFQRSRNPADRTSKQIPITLGALCNACMGLIANQGFVNMSWPGATTDIHALQGTLDTVPFLSLGEWLPRAPTPDVPEHLPEPVAAAMLQAERARMTENNQALAAMGYRRTIELAMKSINTSGGSLVQRIDNLVAAGKLTQELGSWAHEVRVVGNDGAHDFDEPSTNDIEDVATFTRLFLLYTFTLPAMLAARRAAP